MTWFGKTKYVELDLGGCLELGRKNWDKAHSEEGECVMSLALSTRHIGETCVLMLGGVLQRNMFLDNVAI